MTPIIEFKNYTFKYRAQVEPTLLDINLKIYPGEKVLIVGPSGSGKSTLAHCINGLVPFSYAGESKGSLTVGGAEPAKTGIFGMSKIVGTVLQDTDGQFIGLTVGEDIAFALENDRIEQSEMFARVDAVAKEVDVKNLLRQSPNALSGGQKQRVSMAGVMVDDVDILLFDEPLANLDPATGKRAIALIDEIQKKKDTTILIIEHRLEDVLYREVDRIIVFGEGRIVADTTPDKLMTMDVLEKEGIRNVHIAYGTIVKEIKEVSRSYKEAKMALDVGKIFFDERNIIAYSELGIGRLIYQLPIPLCKMFIKEIFGGKSPDDFDEETLTTIMKFFENSLNVSETSRQLFIHRNTLVYRLDKLQKTTNLDLRVFEDAITFKIALMVVKYMKYMESFEY